MNGERSTMNERRQEIIKERIRRLKWPTEAEMKQDLLDDTRAALCLAERLEEPWEPDAGPAQEGHDDEVDEVAPDDIVREIIGRLMCIERQLIELFTGVRGKWRNNENASTIDMP